MEMDQNNRAVLPCEEIPRSSENKDVFDLKCLKNCLPTTSRHSEIVPSFEEIERTTSRHSKIVSSFEEIERVTKRFMKIKALLNIRKETTRLSLKRISLDKLCTAFLANSVVEESACHKQEKYLETEPSKALERLTFANLSLEKEEKNISPMHSSDMMKIDSEIYFERKKAERRRNVLAFRTNERLRKACFSRCLSLEDMDKPEARSCLQTKCLYGTILNDFIEKRKRIQEEMDQTIKLVQMLKEKSRMLKEKKM
ncbi:uncharacterized protein LOC129976465 [Argiope bruennichi]|uniref:Uncharacterized protein n=1 Tax=Argiope bruennichi TaxID=94029 RepID=A0A8T0EWI1_ARGBR|nr:uncharacterized protein LOC129976465 [Argiope bruennichi]KAF8778736.1 hypothetical protein HNY73_015431 [Argiope bruennichi]